MTRMTLLLTALSLFACSSSDAEPAGPCAQRKGSYLASYKERTGTCGANAERISNMDRQPTTQDLQAAGCEGAITYSADNCEVTYESLCPENGIVNGGRLRIAGKSTWNQEGSLGSATEQWSAVDSSGRTLCQSTYDVSVRRQ